MESIKSTIKAQPGIVLAIIVVLLVAFIFLGAKNRVERFVRRKTSKALDEEEEKEMDKMINEIHDIQKI